MDTLNNFGSYLGHSIDNTATYITHSVFPFIGNVGAAVGAYLQNLFERYYLYIILDDVAILAVAGITLYYAFSYIKKAMKKLQAESAEFSHIAVSIMLVPVIIVSGMGTIYGARQLVKDALVPEIRVAHDGANVAKDIKNIVKDF